MGESKEEPPVRNGKAAAQLARFGVFEFRLDTGELRRSGASVRVQRRSFRVLQALLECPGEVVNREELRARIWPEGTFVDFESGLNTAVNRLRSALGDSAESPTYIETVARLGYRFVAPVKFGAAVREKELVEIPNASLLSVDSETPGVPASGRRWWLAAAGITAAAAFIAFTAGTAFSPHRTFLYRQLTFSIGLVQEARFLPDGRQVIYSSVSHGNIRHTFAASIDNDAHPQPSRLADQNELADLSPDVRISAKDGWFALEYPAGRLVYRTRAQLESARVAPQGGRVAFIEHPVTGEDSGCVMVASRTEPARCLSGDWDSVKGLAWPPSGAEVWFTAAASGEDRKLRAVNLKGQARQVAEMPGGMILLDISRAGDVLIARPTSRVSMLSGSLRDKVVRDISLFDWSRAAAISADGSSVLFDESGQGGGRKHGVYLYETEQNKARRIADGRAMDVSSDGAWALIQKADDRRALWLVSTKDHQEIAIKAMSATYNWARFLEGRDCQEIVASVTYPGQGELLMKQELPNGKPVTLLRNLALSDAIVDGAGQMMVGRDRGSAFVLVDLVRKTARPLPLANDVRPAAFSEGRLITSRCAGRAIALESVNLEDGTAQPYGEVSSNEAAGLSELIAMRLAKDGQTFVYSQSESVSTLYVVSGWT
jgi:DNA-binding winged helix-turn-helix (wHTH) protein